MSDFYGAFATGVACQQGTLTLPDTWFRPPLWDLLVLQLLRPDSSNSPCLYSTFHLEYPLVLSRFGSYTALPMTPDLHFLKWCIHLSRSLFLNFNQHCLSYKISNRLQVNSSLFFWKLVETVLHWHNFFQDVSQFLKTFKCIKTDTYIFHWPKSRAQ